MDGFGVVVGETALGVGDVNGGGQLIESLAKMAFGGLVQAIDGVCLWWRGRQGGGRFIAGTHAGKQRQQSTAEFCLGEKPVRSNRGGLLFDKLRIVLAYDDDIGIGKFVPDDAG